MASKSSCLLILKNPYRKEPRIIRLFSSSAADRFSSEELHPPCDMNRTYVDAACHGLVCFRYIDNEDQLFWNPFTNEHKVIPPSHFELTPCDYPRHHTSCSQFHYCTNSGLGYDPKSGDYKFIKFNCISYADDDDNFTHSLQSQISVYSLRTNSWKEVPCLETNDLLRYTAVSTNGFCYWLASKNIVAFDLATDELSILPFPDFPIDRDCVRYLVEYDGILYFLFCSRIGDIKCFRFWIKDVEDGVVACVRKEKFVCGRGALNPLGFWKNGCSFLLQGRDGSLLEYDFVAREMKSIDEIFDRPRSMQLYPYAESSVKLNIERCTLEEKKKTKDKRKRKRKRNKNKKVFSG